MISKIPVSAVVLTYQSDRTIDSVLGALSFCDDIVVVDSGSTDQTLAIARKHGARIFERKFDGYGPQKRYAVDQAKHDWVLVIDSDEVVTPKLQQEIQALFASGRPSASGYEVQIKLVFLGKEMNYGGTGRKFHLRLFNREHGNFNHNLVHEGVELKGQILKLEHLVLHYSYLTIEDYFVKFNTYTTFAAEGLLKSGKRVSKASLFFAFPAHLFKRFILELGFLDGYYGFLWAFLSAAYPLVKYAKLIELQKRQGS